MISEACFKISWQKKGGGVDETKTQNIDNHGSLVKGIYGYIILFSLQVVMVNFMYQLEQATGVPRLNTF